MTGKRYPKLNALRTIYAQALWPNTMREKRLPTEFATFDNFKLLANGVIRDSGSGKVLANCNDKKGIDQKCVANFLRKTVGDSTGENKKGAVLEKAGKSKEKFNKPAAASSASRKPKKDFSERPFSSPFFDQGKSEQQVIEDAWEDAGKRMPGL